MIKATQEAAMQFHLDYDGFYDIGVDADNLKCHAIPCCTLRKGPVKVQILQNDKLIRTESLLKRPLSIDEIWRLALKTPKRNIANGCISTWEFNSPGDWLHCMYGRNKIHYSIASVDFANSAREYEKNVIAAVATGKYPVLLSTLKGENIRFTVIERP